MEDLKSYIQSKGFTFVLISDCGSFTILDTFLKILNKNTILIIKKAKGTEEIFESQDHDMKLIDSKINVCVANKNVFFCMELNHKFEEIHKKIVDKITDTNTNLLCNNCHTKHMYLYTCNKCFFMICDFCVPYNTIFGDEGDNENVCVRCLE